MRHHFVTCGLESLLALKISAITIAMTFQCLDYFGQRCVLADPYFLQCLLIRY